MPLTVDFATSFYFHSEGQGVTMGGPGRDLEALVPIAVHRLPRLADAGIRSAWSGDYVMSPDHNAIVGPVGELTRVFVATGFSGHGFQQGAVIGEHLAELALGRAPTFDLTDLTIDRFRLGVQRVEHNII